MNLIPLFVGYRTYIVAAVGVLVNGLHTIYPHLNLPINEINTVLGFLGLGAFAAKVDASKK